MMQENVLPQTSDEETSPITKKLLQELITKSTYLCLMATGEVTLDLLESYLLTMPQKYVPHTMQIGGNLTFERIGATCWDKIVKVPAQSAGGIAAKLVSKAKWEDYMNTCKFFQEEIGSLTTKDRQLLDEAIAEWIDAMRANGFDKTVQ